MDSSSTADSDNLLPEPTVASILGIQGPLRFRPHGSSQKAHVVLRRVEISDDSSDEGEGGSSKRVVYFSLFAQKRIEVKPGKEILLTVASADGRFKDRPLVFEGDLPTEVSASDEEEEAEEEVMFLPPIAQAIPPKMRRAWTKRTELLNPSIIRTFLYIKYSSGICFLYTLFPLFRSDRRSYVDRHPS